jgi:hypothetical protein
MKLPINADAPHEPFNGAGTAGDRIGEILHGPSSLAVDCAEQDGGRKPCG